MEILAEQSEEKLEKSHGTAIDAAITIGLHLWACLEVRDEFIAIWLEWICVGILRGLNWVYFGMFIEL